MIKTLSHKNVYSNKWTTLYEDDIEFPNGYKGIYGYVERKDGSAAVIINDKNQVLIINQYRYPIKDFQLGIPGGAMEADENPEITLKREVKEETGLDVEIIKLLGKFYSLSSCSTEQDYIYLCKATNELKVELGNEADEVVKDIQFIDFEEVIKMIDDGRITDSASANAIQIALRYLNTHK
jgi:ADP-ribose pyrophosphatase